MRRIFILAAVVALLTAACKIETNFQATLNADATGTVSAEIGLDEEAEGLLQGEDPFEEVPEGSTTRTEERGDMTFYIVTRTFSSAAELEALATEDDGLFTSFEATFENALVTIRGTTADAGGGLLEGEDLGAFDPQMIQENFSANIRITMPGRVLGSNADSTDGSTLTWEVPLTGAGIEVRAESDPTQEPGGSGGFPIWLIVVIASIVVAGAAGFFFMNRRSGEPPPPAPAEAETDAVEPEAWLPDEAQQASDQNPPPQLP